MTDKQIIIDGVDVISCTHFDMNFKHCDILGRLCREHNNCHYKLYKRKEQECEELKNELHKNFEEKDTLHLIIDRLLEASGYDTNTASAEEFEDVYEHMRYEQQQLDRLKAENEQLKDEYKILEDNLDSRTRDFEDVIDSYKQTLAEIKEIAESCGWNFGSEILYKRIEQILQKISECEVEDEHNG